MGSVYLIHFDKPYKHAKHYLGYVKGGREAVFKRYERHKLGIGSVLMKVVTEAGIGSSLSRIWYDKDQAFERKLKARGKLDICPICISIRKEKEKKDQRIIRNRKLFWGIGIPISVFLLMYFLSQVL